MYFGCVTGGELSLVLLLDVSLSVDDVLGGMLVDGLLVESSVVLLVLPVCDSLLQAVSSEELPAVLLLSFIDGVCV